MFSFILLIPADLPVLLDFIYRFYFSLKTTLIGMSIPVSIREKKEDVTMLESLTWLSWWVWSKLELELSKYYSGFKMFADSCTILLGNVFGLLHRGKYLCLNSNCYVNTNFHINKVGLVKSRERQLRWDLGIWILPPYTPQQGAWAWEPHWWRLARSKPKYWEHKCPSLLIPKLKYMTKGKQNSYTESI